MISKGLLDKDDKPISNDIINKFGIPCMSYEEYEIKANKNKEPLKAILNLDWNNGGSHWVGIKTDKKTKTLLYYDPFGVIPPFKNLNRNIIYNPIQDQDLNQSNCGWRSLYFVLN